MSYPYRQKKPIPAGSAFTVSPSMHRDATILFDQLAGSIITLPPALGSGMRLRTAIKVIATSNSHIVKVQNAVDIIIGVLFALGDDAASLQGWAANGTTDDTITLNRTTTGGTRIGEWLEFEDIASGLWHVRGQIRQTGAEATPFSATV